MEIVAILLFPGAVVPVWRLTGPTVVIPLSAESKVGVPVENVAVLPSKESIVCA